MALISGLGSGPVALDTAPLIYYIEADPERLPVLTALFEASAAGRFHLVTSSISLLEVLVLPLRKGRSDLADRYREILTGNRQCALMPVDSLIAERAALLRAKYRLQTPAAIQIATAWVAQATAFVTADRLLARVREVPVVSLDRLVG